jgi:hypothetical protein
VKRPAFQFYYGDWQRNANLRRCTHEEKGIWIDVMCLLADSDEHGVLRWPLAEVANAVGCKLAPLKSLVRKGVMKGADSGERMDALVFTPRHAGKSGDPVELLPAQDGPIWYSSRMVRDEYVRLRRGEGTRFGDTPKVEPKGGIGEGIGGVNGDGPSTASAIAKNLSTPTGVEAPHGALPDCPHEKLIELYHRCLPANPRVVEWNDTRRGYLRARWRQKALPNGRTSGYVTVEDGLAYWQRFFQWCGESKFLTGQADGKPGQPPFVADLEWLMKPSNFAKVLEGKYHR